MLTNLRMLFFSEQDRKGEIHPISAETNEGLETIRIPSPALVDIDSLIQIKVRAPRSGVSLDIFGSKADALAVEKDSVLMLMRLLDKVVEARQKALVAYRNGDPNSDYDTLVNEAAQITIDFITNFRKHYERGTDGYLAATSAVGTGGIHKLKPFLQEKVDNIQKQNELIRERASLRSSKLILEAFLDSPGNELNALHLKGYDNLAEGRVKTRDRLGVKLSMQEQEELSRQIMMTESIARTLDSVRAKEISLQKGVLGSLTIVAPSLSSQIEEAGNIVKHLRDPARIASMKADIKRVSDEANNLGIDLADSVLRKLEQLPDTLGSEIESQSNIVLDLLLLIENARQIEKNLIEVSEARNFNEIPDLLFNIKGFGKNLDAALGALPDGLGEAGNASEAIVNGLFEDIQNDASNAFSEWLNSAPVTEMTSNINQYYADIQRGISIAREVSSIMKIGRVSAARVAPYVPEAFYVDITQLQDTLLDLRRVSGKDGDTVRIRARLFEPGRKTVDSESYLEITHYGHFAKLVPSVVLVRPDEIASGDDGYRFAPALGWMHHYRPRPETESAFANIARPMQLAFGMHAIFLNFDNNPGIGLGATLSFWDDRLQFGAGFNMSANSSEEGQHYFFVGSDLIGLLQTAGIGK